MKAKTTIDRQLFTVGFRRRINPDGGPLTGHLDVVGADWHDAFRMAEMLLINLHIDGRVTFIAINEEAA